MRGTLVCVAVLAVLGVAAPMAGAQPTGGGASWIETRHEPSKLVGGIAVGFARMTDIARDTPGLGSCAEAGRENLLGANLALDVGWRVLPAVAVLGHAEVTLSEELPCASRQTIVGAVARFYASSRLWAQAGAGAGWFLVEYSSGFNVLESAGPVGEIGAGVIAARSGNFGVGLQGRASVAKYDEGSITTFSFSLDFAWY